MQTRHESTVTPLRPAAPVALELKEISKRYPTRDGGTVQAVASVSASIRKGEFIAILGPSGCGKSTLLMMIAGLVRPSGGTLAFGQPSANPSHPDFGIVFQDAVLFPWRTVQANVELPGEVVDMPREQRARKARELIQLVGLTGFEQQLPSELSGGMQQRVAIARSLMLDPQLILMDEPFGALDAMTREQMNLEVQRISLESGATVVFVTHSIAEAAFLADRVFVMSGRPSTVREIIEVKIPRPRPIELMASDRFGVYVSQLRELLNVTGDAS
jgi:NitT/TauT family transport system ATP-binding protein